MSMNLRNQSVNVSRTQLLDALRANLKVHQDEFAAAMDAYKNAVKNKLKQVMERTEAGDFTNINIHIAMPSNHADEFKRVIAMLEMSVDETINLDSDAFMAYFHNEWPWKHNFDALVASYKG